MQHKNLINRRQALRKIAKFLGTTTLISHPAFTFVHSFPKVQPVIIIGGGLAGLVIANELRKAGVRATIFEATDRAGGRIYASKSSFADNFPVELGAEYISKNDNDLLNYIKDLNINTTESYIENASKNNIFSADGDKIRFSRLCKRFYKILPRIKQDFKISKSIPSHLENVRVTDYLQKLTKNKDLISILQTILSCETGIPAEELSAIEFIYRYTNNNKASCFFPDWTMMNNSLRIKESTSIFIERLAKPVIDQMFFNSRLTALEKKNDSVLVTINGKKTFKASAVILTLPFTSLRKVKLNKKQWQKEKWQAIQELKYGFASKYIFQLPKKRRSSFKGKSLRLISDNLGYGWSNTEQTKSSSSTYTAYFVNRAWKNLMATQAGRNSLQKKIITEVARYYPKFKFLVQREKYCDWSLKKYFWGSHPIIKYNQDRKIFKHISQAETNIFFAGDHCDQLSFGRMNGALKSALQTAVNVLVYLNRI